MRNRDHDHSRSSVWRPEPRCTRCGHRIGDGLTAPRQTRELHPLLWPFELAARIEARLRRWLEAS